MQEMTEEEMASFKTDKDAKQMLIGFGYATGDDWKSGRLYRGWHVLWSSIVWSSNKIGYTEKVQGKSTSYDYAGLEIRMIVRFCWLLLELGKL